MNLHDNFSIEYDTETRTISAALPKSWCGGRKLNNYRKSTDKSSGKESLGFTGMSQMIINRVLFMKCHKRTVQIC